MAVRITIEQARKCCPEIDALLDARPPDEAAVQVLLNAGQPVAVAVEHGPGRWSVKVMNWCPTSDNMRAKGLKRWIRGKAADREVIRTWLVEFARVPRAAGKRRLSVHIEKRGPMIDPSNTNKSVRDALVNCGLLVNDNPEWLEAAEPTAVPGKVSSTTIILEDL